MITKHHLEQMITIRDFTSGDTHSVGQLIKDTYSEFNLDFLSPEEQVPFLGPFAYAENPSSAQLTELENVIRSEIVLIAEGGNQIVGVLRGRVGRLGSLFVAKNQQRKGIASQLVDEFEIQIKQQGNEIIKVASTLYAVPFYLKKGYKRSTGIRKSWSFDGFGLMIQPMRKVLE